jgi:hypothetical protein
VPDVRQARPRREPDVPGPDDPDIEAPGHRASSIADPRSCVDHAI